MNLEGYGIGILEYPHTVAKNLWSVRNLQTVWEEAGARVSRYADLSRPAPDVDVWFCHLDSSVVPRDYAQFIDSRPVAVNGGLKDIRKTGFSEQLISSADTDYTGEVIVKSDYNYGGLVDSRLVERRKGWTRLLPVGVRRRLLGLPPDFQANPTYTVYASAKEVPPECFQSPHMVVEKFLPERVGEHYALRMTFLLGSREVSYMITSSEKIVKNRNLIAVEKVETDARVLRWAREHGVEFGKIDYALRDGEPAIFDINRTPGISGASEENQRILAEALAPGILDFLPGAAGQAVQ